MSTTPAEQDSDAGRFGRLARSHRFRAGLSQEQLAGRSGLSARTIRHIESGRSLPRASSVRLLADALDLPPADRAAFTATALPGSEQHDDEAAPDGTAQLPAATPIFTGRTSESDSLLDAARSGKLVIVTGMAGIGKSSLAVHAARRLAPDYPDGQLHLDLCGFSATSPPVDPAEALDRLLRALGVSGRRVPPHRDDRAAMFRAALSERRVLLLLDNAADEEQLRPLLPGDSPSTVLVTSRNQLAGIHDAAHVELELLDSDTAVSLLAEAAGDTGDDRVSLAEIVELCGRLPLAVRIAAAKLRSRPQWTPADLLQRMRRPHHMMSALAAGEDSVSAAFDATYRGLTETRQRLFRLLGTLPVADFDAHAAAALVDAAPADTEDELESLVDAHLLETGRPGRYHFHDLLREYAAHIARQDDGESERAAALGRVLHMFRAAATSATRYVAPHHLDDLPEAADTAAVAIPGIDGHRAAIDWFDTERRNALALVAEAAAHGLDRESIGLAAVVRPFLLYHSYQDDLLHMAQRTVATAQRLGDRRAEAYWLLAEGRALHICGQLSRAAVPQVRALRLYEAIGNIAGQVAVLNALGLQDDKLCRFESGIDHFERAIQLARRAGTEAMEGIARNNCASMYRNLGRLDEAREHLDTAEAIFQRLGHQRELARTRYNLGNLLRTEGNTEAALELHRLVADYAQDHDELEALGFAHNAMATDYEDLGRIAEARTHCERAWEAANRTRRTGLQSEVLRIRGRIQLALNAFDAAEADYTRAQSRAEAADDAHNTALAMHGLADVLAARGETTAADRQYAATLRLYESLGLPEAATLRRRLDRSGTAA